MTQDKKPLDEDEYDFAANLSKYGVVGCIILQFIVNILGSFSQSFLDQRREEIYWQKIRRKMKYRQENKYEKEIISIEKKRIQEKQKEKIYINISNTNNDNDNDIHP